MFREYMCFFSCWRNVPFVVDFFFLQLKPKTAITLHAHLHVDQVLCLEEKNVKKYCELMVTMVFFSVVFAAVKNRSLKWSNEL